MDNVNTLYDIAMSFDSLCLGLSHYLCKFCLLYKALPNGFSVLREVWTIFSTSLGNEQGEFVI